MATRKTQQDASSYTKACIRNVIDALEIANGEWADWLNLAEERIFRDEGQFYTPEDIEKALEAWLDTNPDDARVAGVSVAIATAFGVPLGALPGVGWWLMEEGMI
jgi:hypothetical protein